MPVQTEEVCPGRDWKESRGTRIPGEHARWPSSETTPRAATKPSAWPRVRTASGFSENWRQAPFFPAGMVESRGEGPSQTKWSRNVYFSRTAIETVSGSLIAFVRHRPQPPGNCSCPGWQREASLRGFFSGTFQPSPEAKADPSGRSPILVCFGASEVSPPQMKPPGVARKSAANRSGQEEQASRSISVAAAGPFGDPRQLPERRRALPAQVPGPLPEERPGHVSVGLTPQVLLRAFLQEARLSDSPGQRKQPVQHLARLLPGFTRRVSIIHRLSSTPARVQPACTL